MKMFNSDRPRFTNRNGTVSTAAKKIQVVAVVSAVLLTLRYVPVVLFSSKLLLSLTSTQNSVFYHNFVPRDYSNSSLFAPVSEQFKFHTKEDDDHAIPTLLSTVTRKDKTLSDNGNEYTQRYKYDYVNALNNPLYEELKHASFLNDNNGSRNGNGKLWMDKSQISFHDNLTLAWEHWDAGMNMDMNMDMNVKANHKDPGLKSHDVIALYCPATERDPKRFLDVIQVSQLNRYMDTDSDMNYGNTRSRSWFIPSFPIIREDTCEFRLWSQAAEPESKYKYKYKSNLSKASEYRLVATSGILEIRNGTKVPTNIHLALTERHDEMRVHFSTGMNHTHDDNDNDDTISFPIVIYGKDEQILVGDLDLDIDMETRVTKDWIQWNRGNTTTYRAQDMCQSPATDEEAGKFMSPGLLHSVTFTNLDEDVKYFYRVGLMIVGNNTDPRDRSRLGNKSGMSEVVWSDVFHFQSPILPGRTTTRMNGEDGKEVPLKFIVYADQGVPGYDPGNDGNRMMRFVEREVRLNGIRAVHHFGDLSYARGAGHIWDLWLEMVSVFATEVPLMIGVGNHEYDHTDGGGDGKDPSGVVNPEGYSPEWGNFLTDSGGECGVPTSKRFIMPKNGNGVFWYSFDHGLVHTIMISSEHDLSPSSSQYKWILNDLSRINRTVTPWVIVESHRPLYMTEVLNDQILVSIYMRKYLEPLLKKYDVNLFLSGHIHAYLRTCPGLYDRKCHNGGLTNIMIGTAGANLFELPTLKTDWTAFHSAEWGYGRITVQNETALLFEFVSDVDGSNSDLTWLYR